MADDVVYVPRQELERRRDLVCVVCGVGERLLGEQVDHRVCEEIAVGRGIFTGCMVVSGG